MQFIGVGGLLGIILGLVLALGSCTGIDTTPIEDLADDLGVEPIEIPVGGTDDLSFLDEDGIPNIVERASILPPQSLMGIADENAVKTYILSDEFELKYRQSYDRESAYEIICRANIELEAERAREAEEAAAEKERLRAEAAAQKAAEKEALAAQKAAEKEELAAQKAAEKQALAEEKARQKEAEQKLKTAEKAVNAATSSVMRSVSTNITNTVFGGKKSDAKTIAKRAANNALSSVMRSGSSSVVRGLFGNIK